MGKVRFPLRFLLVAFVLGWNLAWAQYDLVVYGATPQGVTAAVAAAQEGLRVLLLEPGRGLGGVSPKGGWPPWT